MRAVIIACLLALGWTAGAAAQDPHAPWDAILAEYLVQGEDGVNRFRYDALRSDHEDRAALDTYVETLEAGFPSQMDEDTAFAYWANLYNAVTIKLIVDEDPERSIREIKPHPFAIGPWGVDQVTVEGEALSLDNIEHDIMRVRYEAALVHYAVNCASIGCPNLKPTAWCPETLQTDLETAARTYINHPRGASPVEGGVEVSRLYRWYREDFEDSEAGVLAHLRRFAAPDLAVHIENNPNIQGHRYDWGLNRAE